MLSVFGGALWDFQGVNVPVHWEDFEIESKTALADYLISALTTELGS